MDETEYVNVAIRIKPGSQQKENKSCIQIIDNSPPILLVADRNQTFSFDQIFDSETCQKTVYEQTVKPLVKYVKQGYNCTVFGYGQTGTGKTYTIGTESEITDEESLGLIPRTLSQFFQHNVEDDYESEIFVSFIEIYNERVFDLLQNNNNPLAIKGMKPQGYCQERVYNVVEAQHFLKLGNKNRHTAGTKQNSKSSRSHAIFSIYCNVKNSGSETKAKLNLVDLAGCESVKKTGSQGCTFHEGININKGLLSISQVMMALSTNANFVPYRQSIITSVLQDSLNKRNYISLIACVSSLEEDITETLQTLDFAQRLKKVKSRPELNEVVAQFKKENRNLFPANRMGVTPFKRPATLNQQTPLPTKRFKPVETTTDINTICMEQNHTSKSLLSVSGLSAVSSTNTDITQQALSPVIKKYVSAMEASLMDKLEVLIKTNLKRPGDELESRRQEEKENDFTPRMNWNKIHNEVSKMVKSEISRIKTQSIQVTSSPIEFENFNEVSSSSKDSEDFDKIKKKLVYDSPESEPCFQGDSINITEKKYETPVFKVPELPVHKNRNTKNDSTILISPIENCSINIKRSLRLSLKKMDISDVNDSDCSQLSKDNINITLTNNNLPNKSLDFKNRRRSVRLLNKNDTVKVTEKSCCTDDKIEKQTKNIHKRRNLKLSIANTPAGKRILKKKRQDSPHTTHTKQVLNILQTGSIKDLEKLQLIGTKTAHQILLFRQIKGNLNEISDLSQMPGWGEKKYEKFVDQNFLKKELLMKNDVY